MKHLCVVHPGRQHVSRLVRGLEQSGYNVTVLLSHFPGDRLVKISSVFGRKSLLYRFGSHRFKVAVHTDVYSVTFLFGIFLTLSRHLLGPSNRFVLDLDVRHKRIFGKRAAKRINKLTHIEGVICFDGSARYIKNNLRRSVKFYIDNSHPSREFLYRHYKNKLAWERKWSSSLNYFGYLIDEKERKLFTEESLMADYHIVASKFSFKSLINIGVTKNRICLAPYGFDYQMKLSASEKIKNQILFVGELNERKGISYLLQVAKSLPDYSVKIVGRPVTNLSEFIRELQVLPNVEYLSYVTKEKLNELYRHSNFFLFPTLGEGFGQVLIEAAASGCLIVTTPYCIAGDWDNHNKGIIDLTELPFRMVIDKIKDMTAWSIDTRQTVLKQMQDLASNYSYENYATSLKKFIDDTCHTNSSN